MTQQASNPSRTAAILGRYRALIGFLAVAGLLGGAAFAWFNHPQQQSRSSALVVFSTLVCPEGAICGGPAFEPTYAEVEWLQVPGGGTVTPVTWSVLSDGATGLSDPGDQAAADAAAPMDLGHAFSMNYLGQQVSAKILEEATTVTGTATSPKKVLYDGLLGALFAALVGILAALAGSRTTIDPPPAPPGLDFDTVPDFGTAPGFATGPEFGTTPDVSARFGDTGREETSGFHGVSLAQLAREYAERMAAAENG